MNELKAWLSFSVVIFAVSMVAWSCDRFADMSEYNACIAKASEVSACARK